MRRSSLMSTVSPIPGSTNARTSFLSSRGLAHITRLLCIPSNAFFPVISSSSSTPYAYTSVFSSTIPCIEYSGARYLPQNAPGQRVDFDQVNTEALEFDLPKGALECRDSVVGPLLREPLGQAEVTDL